MKAGIKILIGVGAAAAVAGGVYFFMRNKKAPDSQFKELTEEQIAKMQSNAAAASQAGLLQLKTLSPSQTGDAARQALLNRVGISLEEYAGGKVASYKAAGLTGIENLVL